jgi:hypothetical protein
MLIVNRNSFFRGPKGTLIFSESWPPQPRHEHQICNCTREVCERPVGTPNQVKQAVTLSGEEGLPWDFNLGSGWLTFRWGEPDEKGHRPHDPHAYFMFVDKRVRLELCEPHTLEDIRDHVFFGNLYWGNRIDISQMMNGHSPSKVVDLSSIGPDDFWTHECNWGKEAFSLVQGPEIAMWRDLIEQATRIRVEVSPFTHNRNSSVEDIYHKVEGQPFLQLADEIRRTLQPLVLDFKTTEIFRVCKELQARVV